MTTTNEHRRLPRRMVGRRMQPAKCSCGRLWYICLLERSPKKQELQDQAEQVLRRAAAAEVIDRTGPEFHRPGGSVRLSGRLRSADAGSVSQVRDAVDRAWQGGKLEGLAYVQALLGEMHGRWGEEDPLQLRDELEAYLLDAIGP